MLFLINSMRFLLLFFICHSAFAVTCEKLKVLRVIDGDSIVVEIQHNGVPLPLSVRLQFIDTPEMRDGDKENPHGVIAKQALAAILPPGSFVDLSSTRKTFRADGHGRVLALVTASGQKVSAQELMIKNGYSVYWRRFGRLADQQHKACLQLESTAQRKQLGLWKNAADWMQAKRLEARY